MASGWRDVKIFRSRERGAILNLVARDSSLGTVFKMKLSPLAYWLRILLKRLPGKAAATSNSHTAKTDLRTNKTRFIYKQAATTFGCFQTHKTLKPLVKFTGKPLVKTFSRRGDSKSIIKQPLTTPRETLTGSMVGGMLGPLCVQKFSTVFSRTQDG